MKKVLILINDAPYGTEKAYNALRLSMQIQKDYKDAELYVFLMADAVTCALPNQNTPDGYYNIDVVKDSRLFVSTDDLELNKIENDKNFFISFYNVQDFGEVNCDNFTLESEIKNDPKDGGLTCQLAGIAVTGENGIMLATFSDKGCTSKLELSFSDFYLNGSTSDLSEFGADLTQWRNIRYEVVNKNVVIYIDQKEVFRFSYKKDIGKLVGIAYHFYGCGSVKKSKLYDKDGQVVYEEQFDKQH